MAPSGFLMRVLLVEDEPNAAHVLAKGLREQAYAVDLAADGETALFQVGTTDYDAVILDVMLPRHDSFSVCRAIRASGSPVPILMVTARDAVDARIEGLDCGADDYLVKPFAFGELLARLRALARRAGDVVSRADIAEHVWDVHYDPLSNVVDVYIQRLRRKLDRAGRESVIRTRRGEGYQLTGDPEVP